MGHGHILLCGWVGAQLHMPVSHTGVCIGNKKADGPQITHTRLPQTCFTVFLYLWKLDESNFPFFRTAYLVFPYICFPFFFIKFICHISPMQSFQNSLSYTGYVIFTCRIKTITILASCPFLLWAFAHVSSLLMVAL